MIRLDGKRAIVTGGANGIGAAIATALAQAGAHVTICDIREVDGRRRVEALRADGGSTEFSLLDVADEDGWARLATAIRVASGGVDILVNNAGINDRLGVMAGDSASWRRIFATNLDSVFFGLRAIVPLMMGREGASIVNIASTAALSGHSFAAYSTTKWAIRGLTRSAALELAQQQIRVNCICPGVVETDINRHVSYLDALKRTIPLGRTGLAEEVAAAVLYLASPAASFVTGQDLIVDGGMTAGTVVESR